MSAQRKALFPKSDASSNKGTTTIFKPAIFTPIEKNDDNWSPAKGCGVDAPYGKIEKKPWEYACEAWIPVLDTPNTMEYVIELLRLQTKRPYIVLVDTGSTKENFEKLEDQFGGCEDIEIHRFRFKAVKHSSDYPAFAMDLAMSVCRTEHIFHTHSDVFLKRRNVIEELLMLTDEFRPLVGYRMTPRKHADWQKMVSHTCTMMHIPTMDKHSIANSLRKLCNRKGLPFVKNVPEMGDNWPDTEILFNYMLWEHGITGKIIGEEQNHIRTVDDRIDHCRTRTAADLYSPQARDVRKQWVDDAIEQAQKRIELWKKEDELITK